MPSEEDLKIPASCRAVLLVALIALISGAALVLIGVLVGAHIAAAPSAPPANSIAALVRPDICAAGRQTFSYTGSEQIVPVPKECSSAVIEAVGGGGGGFASSQQTGGNGGFASAQISLTGMSQLIVIVGQGGIGSCSGDCSGDDVPPAFGGGGGTHEGNGGGGYSGVFNGSVEQSFALVVAGGGGGGGGGSGGTGGNGGGVSGEIGSNPGSGGAGSQSSGGLAASEDDGYSGDAPGGPLQGGIGAYGGGGGGGYFGGGGGGRQGFWIHAGGGGGSGYTTPLATGSVTNIAGSQLGVSADADAAWKAGLGVGGLNGDGGNGSVTIIWTKKRHWYNVF
jgi:hypothetical protein